MDSITLDLEECRYFYDLYKKLNGKKTLPDLSNLEFESKEVFLEGLALFSLSDATLAIAYSFKSIFLEIISRWVSKWEYYESKIGNRGNICPSGFYILQYLARIIDVVEGSDSLIEYYLLQNNLTDRFKSITQYAETEVEQILLAYYRLIKHDKIKFQNFLSTQCLYEIIAKDTNFSNVSKILATKILARYLEASEVLENHYFKSLVNMSDVKGEYENNKRINYKFIDLIEAQRIRNFFSLPEVSEHKTLGKKLILHSADFSNYVACISGVCIPTLEKSKASAFDSARIVPTNSATKALIKISKLIRSSSPTLLLGNSGSGKTFLVNQVAKYMGSYNSLIRIHLGEQTDIKLLLGTYISGKVPGSFEWKAGVLTSAVSEGRWVLIEDIDSAPTEVLSVLLTLLERREIIIPSRGEVVRAANGFHLFGTIKGSKESKESIPDLIGMRSWNIVEIEDPSEEELKEIILSKFDKLEHFVGAFLNCFNVVQSLYQNPKIISLNKGKKPRIISFRDILKFCARVNLLFEMNDGFSNNNITEAVFDNIFAEAVDCFCSSVAEKEAREFLVWKIGEQLEVPASRIELFLKMHIPQFNENKNQISIGRAILQKNQSASGQNISKNMTPFARTNQSLRLMEQIAVGVEMSEPLLLVGETGTGKTTVIQQLARHLNKRLIVINVSQQTEASDLLGGFKPFNTKTIALPIQGIFQDLFLSTFSQKKNEKFSTLLSKCFIRGQWKNVIKLWKEAVRMAREILQKEPKAESEDIPKKRRKLDQEKIFELAEGWNRFLSSVEDFEKQLTSLENSFLFDFVEGSVVNAVRNGDWLLLDEINLASDDTLESLSELLSDVPEERSIVLTERGDVEAIKAHVGFRIFGCMNPSTDIGKRDLPLSIRSKFSEIYVRSPDEDIQDLLAIIDKNVNRFAVGDEWVGNDISELYLEAKTLALSNKIVDGANSMPHFSIRTLTRTLSYVRDIVSVYGLRRALYEGFCMTFLTLLDDKSEAILEPVIRKFTIGRMKNTTSIMSFIPKAPGNANNFVQFKHYWIQKGPYEIVERPHYIMTPSVEKNMLNLVRATTGRKYPVLIQGPTSAGKTSMIKYLADVTGHKFVRINNHEHTDLQEYIGTFVSDSTGKLSFKEGILVEALRNGHWLVLDELNLAPTDVLEALNRLLDDNRELFIPETQDVVHPHPDFMLFATQNPPGIYGGRKMLSRAFRNRFLELHFDNIPQDELEVILRERCSIAPSYAKKIVEVYRQLSSQRQSNRLFEQKNSFATLRDLFRWALRDAVGYEELAANGYILLAEKVRNSEDRFIVKSTLEKVMKVKLDMERFYEKFQNEELINLDSQVVWTRSMKKLAVLVSLCIKYEEPVLLVGETGCGKTTICQLYASLLQKKLITVNAHQNTETSDLLGAQRPVRNRLEMQNTLHSQLLSFLNGMSGSVHEDLSLEELILLFKKQDRLSKFDSNEASVIRTNIQEYSILFHWADGPLVQAMKDGDLFLLDEISLADDSVLERLNSVLEPEKTLLLAEKGTEDSLIIANEGFQFMATMNPGGDYGKKELSPALRNRFTEIWVPSMEDFDDVTQIVNSRLKEDLTHLTGPIVQFSKWYGNEFGNNNTGSGVISLRDILAWVEFLNSSKSESEYASLLHGCLMVFIDSLGTNNTAYLSEDEQALQAKKLECVTKLSNLVNYDLSKLIAERYEVNLSDDYLTCGIFSLRRFDSSRSEISFNLNAPTTAKNAMRVIRAMQVNKPILLEGSPGVGKTSLVSALAKATGKSLIRINLSEQTDLIDLFGSDFPVEGGNAGEFVWRDAPFLRAMKKGEWVLLDEMNLASQSVLEGLNACLDHRGEAYIPELDKRFPKHPNFIVFAAQNPQFQGGGRKGLPKSFVNRFSVVYVDMLKTDDLSMISNHLYPNIPQDDLLKIIHVVSVLEHEVVHEKSWGISGAPWEFNLRDTLRWLSLLESTYVCDSKSAADFLNMIVCHRFRTQEDKKRARDIFASIFGSIETEDNFYNLGNDYLQVGNAIIKRRQSIRHVSGQKLISLQCNYEALETAIHCVNQNLPLILVGPASSGKTNLVRLLAELVGEEIIEFAMNSDIDSMDLLGGYEQLDMSRLLQELLADTLNLLAEVFIEETKRSLYNIQFFGKCLHLMSQIHRSKFSTENYNVFLSELYSLATISNNEKIRDIYRSSEELASKLSQRNVKFQWFDGILVKAIEKGQWLILDNANLCSPSVLDRLNSLLESNGNLILNECSNSDGSPRVIHPHPNFRLFMTMNPKYGELSRAMRNRGVEVYLEALNSRLTQFDSCQLECLDPVSHSLDIEIDSAIDTFTPISSFMDPGSSFLRAFGLAIDIILNLSDRKAANVPVLVNSVLNFSSLRAIDDFVSALADSKEFNDDVIQNFITVKDIVMSDRGSRFTHNINSKYNNLSPLQIFTEDFAQSQSLNPLLNSRVARFLSIKYPEILSQEATIALYLVNLLNETDQNLRNLEYRAMNENLNKLNYLENSIAHHNGRNVKKIPAFDIAHGISQIFKFISNVFELIMNNYSYKYPRIYQYLFKLGMILKLLIECGSRRREAQMRSFIEIIISFVEPIAEEVLILSTHPAFVEFNSSVRGLIEGTTGNYMIEIWDRFRGTYPISKEAWENAEKIKSLCDEFDKVAWSQFSDSAEYITNLRVRFVELYKDLVTSNLDSDDLNSVFKMISDSTTQLNKISSRFIFERTHVFASEFELLTQFLELSNSSQSSEQRLKLSPWSGRRTSRFMSEIKLSKGVYPSILENVWKNDIICKELDIKSLISDTFIRNVLVKTKDFNNLPLSSLGQSLEEAEVLLSNLIENSKYLSLNKINIFKDILVDWIINIFESCNQSFDKSQYLKIYAELKCIKDSKDHGLDELAFVLSTIDNAFVKVARAYFLPALSLVFSTDNLKSLGKAWILFSCGSMELFVPGAPKDPAVTDHILYQIYQTKTEFFSCMKSDWSSAQVVYSGSRGNAIENTLDEADNDSEPPKPSVYRNELPIDELYDYWTEFLNTSTSEDALVRQILDNEMVSPKFFERVEIFQKNSASFLERLDRDYLIFSDVNDILKGYILGLKVGLELVSMQLLYDSSSSSSDVMLSSNLFAISSTESFFKESSEMLNLCKSLNSEVLAVDKISSYLFLVGGFYFIELSDQRGAELMKQALQAVYYRWSLSNIKQEEDEIMKSSIYKYKAENFNAETEFKKLFPDFEEVLIIDDDKKYEARQSDDTYFQHAMSYIQLFSSEVTIDFNALIQKGADISGELVKLKLDTKFNEIIPSKVTSIVYELNSFLIRAKKNTETESFYFDNSYEESTKALHIIFKISARVKELLLMWPENASLQTILRACDEFSSLPISSPVARLLQKVEMIYTNVSEWEKFAHSKVSMNSLLEELTNLIVSWRRLELSSWRSLLEFEEKENEKEVGKWWFYLYETIIVPNYQESNKALLKELLETLQNFILSSSIGNFKIKLKLIRAFANHTELIFGKEKVYHCLINLSSYYEKFLPEIQAQISSQKKQLEKEVAEVILLASWKDVNIDALKQSARKSHSSLFKIIRKYRSFIQAQVSLSPQRIDSSMKPENSTTIIRVQKSGPISSHMNVKLGENISSWNERTAILKSLEKTNANMLIYLEKFDKFQYPVLNDFAVDVLEQAEDLRKRTPKVFRKEDKKVISALKSQKMKLMSNTFKEMKRIGIKSGSKSETSNIISSIASILANSKSLNSELVRDIDTSFLNLIEILPELRMATAKCHDDVPQLYADRGMASVEQLTNCLISTREPLSLLAESVSSGLKLYGELCDIVEQKDAQIAPVSKLGSIDTNIQKIEYTILWLPKLIESVLAILESSNTKSPKPETDIFHKVSTEIRKIGSKISSKSALRTSEDISVIEDFMLYLLNKKLELKEWCLRNPNFEFLGLSLITWIDQMDAVPFVYSSTSLSRVESLEAAEMALRDLVTTILVSIQNIRKSVEHTITEEDDGWFVSTYKNMQKNVSLSLHSVIHFKLRECFQTIASIEYNEETRGLLKAMVQLHLPIIENYMNFIARLLGKTKSFYLDLGDATLELSQLLLKLCQEGFCSPEQPEKNENDSQNLEDGTGLGDGEGANSNSNDVEEDEDLLENAQDRKEKDEEQEGNNDDALEIEGDMPSEQLEDLSENEDDNGSMDEEDDDLDEEIDNKNPMDPGSLDEKLWDADSKEMEEKNADDVPGDTEANDDIEAQENEQASNDSNGAEEKQSDDAQEKSDAEKEEDENADIEEEEDVQEQEDKVTHEEDEINNNNIPESEVLDLPEDINLDSGEDEEDESENENAPQENMDLDSDDDKDPQEETEDGKQEQNQEDSPMDIDQDEVEEKEDARMDENDEIESQEEEETNDAANMEEDEPLKEENEEPNIDRQEKGQNTEDGLKSNSLEDENNSGDEDLEGAISQNTGVKSEGADALEDAETNDIGGQGETDKKQELEPEESSKLPDESRESARESLKQLGDALKEYHNRRQEIKESSDNAEKEETKDSNVRPDEFEHIDGENADFNTQALGAANEEQVQPLDESKAIYDDIDELKEDAEEEPSEINEVKELEEASEMPSTDKADASNQLENEETQNFNNAIEKNLSSAEIKNVPTELELSDEDEYLPEIDIYQSFKENEEPSMDMIEAMKLWRESDLATKDLTSSLSEQLRLILEPTVATKLRGDYKTGKRLNMKKIISYIASDFRKDKIWLRRTKPSKRKYQIMIAVDDSKSMSESNAIELTLHSIALVSKALTQLESGDLSIVRFGEDIKVLHEFNKPFNNLESGPKVFQWFDFKQEKTNILQLCKKSLSLFENARTNSNAELWQLEIIISDGVCEDHESILKLVRRARESKIMLVFVIIDGIKSDRSILDMNQVDYVKDPMTGNSVLQVSRYLDSFPFEFYVVVKDINELPQMLSLILRQFFSEAASV